MKAIQIHETGGPEVLKPVELPIPEPGQGQVLIRVEAIGLNFVEIYFRKGVYKATLPITPGSEAAGTVEEVGPGVTGFSRSWVSSRSCLPRSASSTRRAGPDSRPMSSESH